MSAVHQKMPGVVVRNVWVLICFPGAIVPSSSARLTAVFTQRQAVVGCASMILPWLMSP